MSARRFIRWPPARRASSSSRWPRHGLEWVQPDAPLAHPLDDGTAVLLERSLDATARRPGPRMAPPGSELMEPLAAALAARCATTCWRRSRLPRHPVLMARFGLHGHSLRRAPWRESRFRGPRARALFAGLAAHSVLPLEGPLSAAIGLVLGVAAHAVRLAVSARRRAAHQRCPGRVPALARRRDPHRLARHRAARCAIVMCDITPRQLLALAGGRFPADFRRAPGALPLRPGRVQSGLGAGCARSPGAARECARAGTVHLGGTLEEIAEWEGGLHRPALRAGGAAHALRPHPRSRRPPHRCGPTATCPTARRRI